MCRCSLSGNRKIPSLTLARPSPRLRCGSPLAWSPPAHGPNSSGRSCDALQCAKNRRHLEEQFAAAALRYPERIAFRVGYEEPLAHRLVAGGDILLHPARYEPCGLTQLYAMRYGTLPVVRNTGGLRDTVVDATNDTLSRGTATGFVFEGTTSDDMVRCVERALALYRQPMVWRKVQRQAMAQDFGWEKSAHRYLALYRSLVPHAATPGPGPKTEEVVRAAG